MEPRLEERAVASGELLKRAQRVVADLQVRRRCRPAAATALPAALLPFFNPPRQLLPPFQTDVGGLLWELDQRLGSTFSEAVAERLPAIQAAAAAPPAPSPRAPASPADAGRQLLQAAQERAALLQRAYNTIAGLQQDVDACLAELGSGGAAGCGSPLPFPPLGTPGSERHSTTTLRACSAGASEHEPQQQAHHVQAQQGWQLPDAQQRWEQGTLPRQPQQRPDSSSSPGAATGSLAGSQGGDDTPPAQRLQPALPPALSPDTAAFVGAAFSARNTEAAEHAAQPCAILNTSLRDASLETSR